MRKIVFLALAFFVGVLIMGYALAADLELGFGKSDSTINFAYMVGATDRFSNGLRWHVGFADLGSPAFGSDASSAIHGDDHYPASATAHWSATRDNIEIYATVSPEFRFAGQSMFVDLGAAVYRQTWHQEIVDGTSFVPPENRYKVTPVVGLGVNLGGGYAVEAMAQRIAADGDFDDETFNDTTYTVMMKRAFK